MRKMIFILVFFVSNSIFAQIEIDWLKLRDVYYKSEYREEMYGYFQIPYFGEELESLEPKSIDTCVLLRKKLPSAMSVKCTYVGFDIDDEFVVGYGLDYDDYYRNFPDICVINP